MTTQQQKVIYQMISENTGSHMLDSGGAYGRHWERNKKKTVEDFIAEPVITIRPEIYRAGDLDLNVVKSLFHHLDDNLDYDKDMDELWHRFDEHYPDLYWTDDGDVVGTMRMFYRWAKKHDSKYHSAWEWEGEKYCGYTYNDENILSQDFVYYQFGLFVFIQSHNGCDARDGFSQPVLFRIGNANQVFDYNNYSLCCSNGHYWDFQGGYEETEQEMYLFDSDQGKHTVAEVIDADDPEFIQFEGDYAQQMKEWMASKRAYELMDALPGMDKPSMVLPPELLAGKVLLKDGHISCPVCSEELFVSCF